MKVYVLEYSIQQECFHIDTLERLAEKNRNMIQRGFPPQYAVIYWATTHEECSSMYALLLENLKQ